MDLSFPVPSIDDATPVPGFDLARVLAALGEGSAQVAAHRSAQGEWLAPAGGAFSAAMAARLVEWQQE